MTKRPKPAGESGAKHTRAEHGAIIKKGRGYIKAALVYPNTYKAGMSSLGFQTVYKLVNQLEFVACERVFLPDKKGHPKGLKSLESGLPLERFDIILFSISFENDFLHLVRLLGESGIPLRSPDRNHTHPLVVAGGVACFLNPLPISPFMDCFLLGEAECLVEKFFTLYKQTPQRGVFLNDLEANLPGAYVPSRHTKTAPASIQVQYIEDLRQITTTTTILSHDAAFKDTFLIETLKGCPHGCRFCSAGFIYRPPRIYPAQTIYNAIESLDKNRDKTKTDKIGLVSSAIADHPEINAICNFGIARSFQLSFSSLRADKLSDELINALARSKVKTATIAPEAGSDRMRAVINKNIEEIDILNAARRLVEAGIINLRLYFMIGLPFETDEDVHAIVELTRKIKSEFLEASRKKKKIGTITLSINPFIPKPATPFQWAAMTSEKTLKARVKIIREGLKKTANVNINIESLRQAKIHALLSCGDEKTADVIELAHAEGWPTALRQNKSYCSKIIYGEKTLGTPLPWDFLDNRVSKSFLEKEYRRAQAQKRSPSCPMIDCRKCKTCIF